MRTEPALLPLPHGRWNHPAARTALDRRDIGAVFKHYRRYTGESQTAVGSRVDLAQSDVSAIERSHRVVQSIDVLTRIAAALQIPLSRLGLREPSEADTIRHSAPAALPLAARVTAAADREDRRHLARHLISSSATLPSDDQIPTGKHCDRCHGLAQRLMDDEAARRDHAEHLLDAHPQLIPVHPIEGCAACKGWRAAVSDSGTTLVALALAVPLVRQHFVEHLLDRTGARG